MKLIDFLLANHILLNVKKGKVHLSSDHAQAKQSLVQREGLFGHLLDGALSEDHSQ
jgi:hypothetical protein